ncbi:hypothetical protein GCM10009737_23750 [Nocardioides lentus]|uniref:Fibronectin type-III domain-containing protein n=1 Tax=Nocardioides lentus TaxID=338077 RepID=A0ABP5ATY2_9ACTN
MARGVTAAILSAAVVLVASLPSVRPAAAEPPARVPAPTEVEADAKGRDVTIRWRAVDDPRVVAYQVSVMADWQWDTEQKIRVPQGQDPSAHFSDLPMMEEHRATVSAVTDSGPWSDSVQVNFTPVAEVTVEESGPLVQVGDGHDRPRPGLGSGQAYERRVWFRLSEPMPLPVRLRPYLIEQQTHGNDFGPDAVSHDQGFPASADDPLVVPAGAIRGFFVIKHWGDDWRRFEWSRSVFGLTSSEVGLGWDGGPPVGALDVDRVRVEHLMYEDDPHRWPLVVDGTLGVEAGATARVPLRLRSPAVRRTVLSVRTMEGSARAGRDFRVRRETVTIRPGSRTAWLHVPTFRRGMASRVREFRVQVTAARGQSARVVKRSGATVRIRP